MLHWDFLLLQSTKVLLLYILYIYNDLLGRSTMLFRWFDSLSRSIGSWLPKLFKYRILELIVNANFFPVTDARSS
jgi:hypothetical protein